MKNKVLEFLKARQSKSRIVYTFGNINELSKEEMDLIDHIKHSWGVDLLNETLEDDENKLEKEKENE